MRALLSVADREGITSLARDLLTLGVEVYATDGTREHLAADGIAVASVGELTAVPSLLAGQVKTFHPAIYAGILARRDREDQLAELAEQGIGLLDLVVVNVRPFAPQVGARLVPLDEAVEMIDVGGVALLSAAARNFAGVAAVSSPAAYPEVLADIRARGSVSAELRERLAADAFAAVAAYNAEVAAYLNHVSGVRFPDHLTLVLDKQTDLAYGENPHQEAAFYRETTHRQGSLADATQLHGPPASFNDLLSMDAAYRMVSDFAAPADLHGQGGDARRARLARRPVRGVPEGARGRRGRRQRLGGRLQPAHRRRHRQRDPGEPVRGGRGARLRRRGTGRPGAQG